MPSIKVSFRNRDDHSLSAKLELPMLPKPIGYAIFAHVFTGSKNLKASRIISKALNMEGFAVLRFDFTGLGESEGEFSNTNFSSNVMDLMAAADFLEENYMAPSLIVGHSLGGSASIFAGSKIDSIKAIATIGSPFDPEHVTHLLHEKIDEIQKFGEASVNIQGRDFIVKKQFIDDLRNQDMLEILSNLRKAILVLHSPQDRVVEIENAANLYKNAMHPKSFVTLNGANHMLTNKDDAYYTGEVIASWAKRYIPEIEEVSLDTDKRVVARLQKNALTTEIMAGKHFLLADESEEWGGYDFGPSPYELLTSSLVSSVSMTLRQQILARNYNILEVEVHLGYTNKFATDLELSDNKYLDSICVRIELSNDVESYIKDDLLQVAKQSPIFLILKKSMNIDLSIFCLHE